MLRACAFVLAPESRGLLPPCPLESEGGADAGNYRSRHGRLHEEKSADEGSRRHESGETPAPARGGLRPRSRGPRWTNQAIHRWRTFPASPCARWHALARSRQERPLWRAAGSPEQRDFGRCEKGALRLASQPPLPIRAENHASSRAPRGPRRAHYRRGAESGDKFFRGFEEGFARKRKNAA